MGSPGALPFRSDAASASQTERRMASPGAAAGWRVPCLGSHQSAVSRACFCARSRLSRLGSRAFKELSARPPRPPPPQRLHVTSPAPGPHPSRLPGELQPAVQVGGAPRLPPSPGSPPSAQCIRPRRAMPGAGSAVLCSHSAPCGSQIEAVLGQSPWEKGGTILGCSPLPRWWLGDSDQEPGPPRVRMSLQPEETDLRGSPLRPPTGPTCSFSAASLALSQVLEVPGGAAKSAREAIRQRGGKLQKCVMASRVDFPFVCQPLLRAIQKIEKFTPTPLLESGGVI